MEVSRINQYLKETFELEKESCTVQSLKHEIIMKILNVCRTSAVAKFLKGAIFLKVVGARILKNKIKKREGRKERHETSI
jgi:hypothetical protein